MPTRRTRDHVWITLMTLLAVSDEEVTQDRIVRETGVSERTVRETLNVAAETCLVDRVTRPDGTARYRPGPGLK
ncbi:MAG: hypothetical protein ACOCUO_00860 [archaeon]